jgi:hypothetical protein
MKRDNKIKVCRILAVVFLCFWTISGVRVLAQNATSILDKAASAYEDSNGLLYDADTFGCAESVGKL